MFDPTSHMQRLYRAQRLKDAETDFLIRFVTDDMMLRLSTINRTFHNAIALFGRTEYLASTMAASPQIASVKRIEEPHHCGTINKLASPTLLELEPQSADLILAPLTLHWSNDLPGTMVQLRQSLRPDGLLLAALPGPDTLNELRGALLTAESELSGGAAQRVDAFTDIRDAGGLLQRGGFALPVVDQEIITVRYDNALDLIGDLRRFGATSQRENNAAPHLTKAIVERMGEVYAEQYSDPDGRIRASFAIVSMSGWAPHESQQKPLKPGSAQTRLADALNTEEKKL